MLKSLRALLTVAVRFLREHRGGATGFAAAAVVMMMLGGAALISDHVWLVGKRDLLQSAADAASVATTQRLATLPGSMTDAEVHADLLPVAERYARINVLANVAKELEPEDVEVVLAVDRGAGTVDVRVIADIGDTLLAKWLYDYGGPGDMQARAGAEHARSPAEVVLALDTTLSTNRRYAGSGKRIEAIKAAATDLVDILQPSAATTVAVGLVPWTTMVRLGADARAEWHGEGWAAFPARRSYPWPYFTPGSGSPSMASVQDIPESIRGTWHGCVEAARIIGGVAEVPGRDAALDTPEESPFAEAYAPPRAGTSYRCFGTGPLPSDYQGQYCWDRDSKEGSSQTLIYPTIWPPADHPQVKCPRMSALMPLSTERTAIDDAIDGLRPSGVATHSAVGVQWARRLLAPTWREVWGDPVHPVDTTESEHADVRKVMVLLTDGEDNIAGGASMADVRSHACADAKEDGIEIFVVAAMEPRHVGGGLARSLRRCASSPAHVYINNPNSQALRDAFRDIATRVSTLRRVY